MERLAKWINIGVLGTILLVVAVVIRQGLIAPRLNSPRLVSLIQLIATPERYAGQRIEAMGYFVIQDDDIALYLYRTDAEAWFPPNKVDVNLLDGKVPFTEAKNFSGAYVEVVGTFRLRGAPYWSWPALMRNGAEPQIAKLERIQTVPFGPNTNSRAFPPFDAK